MTGFVRKQHSHPRPTALARLPLVRESGTAADSADTPALAQPLAGSAQAPRRGFGEYEVRPRFRVRDLLYGFRGISARVDGDPWASGLPALCGLLGSRASSSCWASWTIALAFAGRRAGVAQPRCLTAVKATTPWCGSRIGCAPSRARGGIPSICIGTSGSLPAAGLVCQPRVSLGSAVVPARMLARRLHHELELRCAPPRWGRRADIATRRPRPVMTRRPELPDRAG